VKTSCKKAREKINIKMKRYKRDHLSSNDIAVNALIAQAMRQNKRFLLLNFNNKHILNLIKII